MGSPSVGRISFFFTYGYFHFALGSYPLTSNDPLVALSLGLFSFQIEIFFMTDVTKALLNPHPSLTEWRWKLIPNLPFRADFLFLPKWSYRFKRNSFFSRAFLFLLSKVNSLPSLNRSSFLEVRVMPEA